MIYDIGSDERSKLILHLNGKKYIPITAPSATISRMYVTLVEGLVEDLAD